MGGGQSASEHMSSMNGDYKAERSAEQFRMQIIDPRVNTNAHIPSQHGSLPNYGRKIISDFPSEHGKRSLLKLDPLDQRRIRVNILAFLKKIKFKFKSVESRPITTSTYLTESLNRHAEMEASKLRQYLKTSGGEANKHWDKPAWPGPKVVSVLFLRRLSQIFKENDDNDESSRSLKEIVKKIESLQKVSFVNVCFLNVINISNAVCLSLFFFFSRFSIFAQCFEYGVIECPFMLAKSHLKILLNSACAFYVFFCGVSCPS